MPVLIDLWLSLELISTDSDNLSESVDISSNIKSDGDMEPEAWPQAQLQKTLKDFEVIVSDWKLSILSVEPDNQSLAQVGFIEGLISALAMPSSCTAILNSFSLLLEGNQKT